MKITAEAGSRGTATSSPNGITPVPMGIPSLKKTEMARETPMTDDLFGKARIAFFGTEKTKPA